MRDILRTIVIVIKAGGMSFRSKDSSMIFVKDYEFKNPYRVKDHITDSVYITVNQN